ncbi:DUF1700 domain-containing protein [Clostridioides difficile]|uniref:DUF1700 domain-containing protein n=1 Tax=unclassified Clostridioides TaxID=2635829 RepID=UPI0006BBD24A|nr:hypothetical protein KW95_07340 [Clostridioides difficile]KPI53525.1 hypothetical protein KW94_07215 [Clostridioides difficile]MDB3084890.1 DUF1700 domain-containing protein [Clostridioides difficile]MDI0265583.1 DUF1700 domain-containing protein [Clostridioides difficile]MDI7815083.1 DUF1700 domain-containing protein [Clostridioides difficile]
MNLNKTEFLEILKDYLKKDFSESEVNDILRDYEEYFVDGLIEGKSDMEIIASLGSPKSIARELILQTKEKDTEEEKIINTDVLNDKFSKFKSDMKKGYSILKDEAKEKYNKSKENINDKLTPSIEEGVGGLSRQVIKVLLVVLSLFLIIPAFAFVCAIISVAIGLICTLIAFVISIPFVIKFITMVPDITMFCIFAIIAFVGLEILAWQILLFVIKLGKQLLGSYINWIKRKNIYINANEKMEKRNKDILRDEDLNKDINEDLYSNDYYNTKEESIKKTDDYDDSINFEAMYKDFEDLDDKKGEDKHE